MLALQQTMQAARDLHARLKDERARRAGMEERMTAAEERAHQAERLAEGLNRAREHVSTAVLDALAKEKAKNALLERTMQMLQHGDAWPAGAPVPNPPPADGSRESAFSVLGSPAVSPEPAVRPPLGNPILSSDPYPNPNPILSSDPGSLGISDELTRWA